MLWCWTCPLNSIHTNAIVVIAVFITHLLFALCQTASTDTAAALVEAVDVLGITPPQRLHPLRDALRCIRRQQPAHGVGHQHSGVHRTAVFLRAELQPVQIEAVILFSKKTGRTVVAALHDVLRMIGQVDAWAARHGGVRGIRSSSNDGRGLEWGIMQVFVFIDIFIN
jgi:hypothetical protein